MKVAIFLKTVAVAELYRERPFYLANFGVETCPMYDCPINKKGYKSCAECSELPCKIFYDWRDPSMTDEAFTNSINERVKNLKDSLG